MTDLRLLLLGNQADLLDRGLRQHAQLVGRQAKARGPHRHLLQRLLAGDIEGLHPLRQTAHGLQQQGRLARPRVATDQDRRARHHPAPQNPIQLLETGGETGDLGGGDLRQRLHLAADGAGITGITGTLARGHRAEAHLADGVPLLALTALALPACEVGATFGTNIGSSLFFWPWITRGQDEFLLDILVCDRQIKPRIGKVTFRGRNTWIQNNNST